MPNIMKSLLILVVIICIQLVGYMEKLIALSAIVFAVLIRRFDQAHTLFHHPFFVVFIENAINST